jgi:CRISPR-associated protein Cas2
MSFWVLDLEAAPPRLRGAVSRWAIEVRAGLYVGVTSVKTRDEIWKLAERELRGEGRGVLVFPSQRQVTGFEVRTTGVGRRAIADVDGLSLAQFRPLPSVAGSNSMLPTQSLGEEPEAQEVEPEEWFERSEREREDD